MTTLTASSITVDTTGDYTKFIKGLEVSLPTKISANEIRFVLHSDENKLLYVPRKNNSKGRYDIFVNPTDIQELKQGWSDAHHAIALLLEDRVKTNGYYVIWESATHILLVSSNTKEMVKKVKGFGV